MADKNKTDAPVNFVYMHSQEEERGLKQSPSRKVTLIPGSMFKVYFIVIASSL